MKVLVSWLHEIVPIPVGIEELADALTMRGFEVSAIEAVPTALKSQSSNEPSDAVLDLEITTNRPDCLGMVGVAREVATIYNATVTLPTTSPVASDGERFPVTIEEDVQQLCTRYAATTLNVQVRPSPTWLTKRLEASDIRPINNVVDVTNYVMLEYGHPMHAFDLEQLTGHEIRIRLAQSGESIRTLDGEIRTLSSDTLVIADAKRPQAIAGIMGGADSEVTTSTTRILLESAHFDPISVRLTGKRLALSTDASYRFERGTDIEAPVQAMRRALHLLLQIEATNSTEQITDTYPAQWTPPQITLRHSRIGRVLGTEISEPFVKKTLERLGFALKDSSADTTDSTWHVTVPTHRVDVHREIDLIEEVARHHGYDRLPSTFPTMTQPPSPLSTPIREQQLIRRTLTATGCSEAITYGFIEEIAASPFLVHGEELVRIANPLSEQYAVLRPSVLPGLIDSLIYNRRREHHDIRLFEIGHRFRQGEGENPSVAIAATGAAVPQHWAENERQSDLFDIKGIVERLCEVLEVEPLFDPKETHPALVVGRSATIKASTSDDLTEITLGHIGQLLPNIALARGFPSAGEDIYVAELDLDMLGKIAVDQRKKVVTPIPRHPSIVRDIAIVISSAVPAGDIRKVIQETAADTLSHVEEFDRYEGKGIPDGYISLALRLTFRANDRTLTDVEVRTTIESVIAALKEVHNATLR